jgi:S1-C subfamily serine protease
MHLWSLLLLLPAQVVETKDFPKSLQMRAVAATVRIANRSERTEGTGVIIGDKDGAIYILTAAHLADSRDRLEISTFSEKSYPLPMKTYDKVEVVLRVRDIRDVALIRIASTDRAPALMPFCPAQRLPGGGPFEALSVGCGASKTPMCMLEKVSKEKKIRRPPGRETARFWEVEVQQAPGRSGGPLLDKDGCLIGLASGISEGRGYFTHAAEIQNWLKKSKFKFLVEENEKK